MQEYWGVISGYVSIEKKRYLKNAMRGALAPVKGPHFAAMTKREEIGRLLSMIDNYKGTVVRISYLKLSLEPG